MENNTKLKVLFEATGLTPNWEYIYKTKLVGELLGVNSLNVDLIENNLLRWVKDNFVDCKDFSWDIV